MKMEESNTMTKEEMMAKVEFLKEQLSGDMFEDMDIKISNNAEIEKNQIILNNYGFMILEDKKD